MLRENRVKRMIAEGKLALAGHVSFAEPALVEILGATGLLIDWGLSSSRRKLCRWFGD